MIRFRRWVIVGLLCAIAFVLYIDRVNLMVAISAMRDEFGLSDAACGVVLSAFQFGYAAGLVPGGWLADRFGPYRVLVAAGFSWSVCTVLTLARLATVGRRHPSARSLASRARVRIGGSGWRGAVAKIAEASSRLRTIPRFCRLSLRERAFFRGAKDDIAGGRVLKLPISP